MTPIKFPVNRILDTTIDSIPRQRKNVSGAKREIVNPLLRMNNRDRRKRHGYLHWAERSYVIEKGKGEQGLSGESNPHDDRRR
jgi:hypothetical protein